MICACIKSLFYKMKIKHFLYNKLVDNSISKFTALALFSPSLKNNSVFFL